MALWDLSNTNLQDLSANQAITTTRWNYLLGLLRTLVNGGIDRANITDGGLLPADGDGTFATLDEGSVTGNTGTQTFSRDTGFTGELVYGATTVDATDTTPSVDGINTLYIDNNTSGTVAFTRFDDPIEGQELTLVIHGDDPVNITGTAVGSLATAGEIVTSTAGGNDIAYAAADEYVSARFRATTLDGTYSVLVWILIGTPEVVT